MGVEIDKVKADIEKTGFPLELRVSRLLGSAGYTLEHNLYYVDKDENKGREIEICADKLSSPVTCEDKVRSLTLTLIVECKKSTNAWVVFTSPWTSVDDDGRILKTQGLRSLDNADWDSTKQVRASHPTWNMKRRGRSSYVALRNKGRDEDFSPIFKAVTAVIKATLELHAAGVNRREARVLQPIGVLDGELLEAYLDADSSMIVQHESWIPISFAYQSPNYAQHRFNVIVVTERHFWSFLDRMNAFSESLSTFLACNPRHFGDYHQISVLDLGDD